MYVYASFSQNTCLIIWYLYADLLFFEMSLHSSGYRIFCLVALPYKKFASKIFIKEPF
jgi:hypothetical protein